ncbi:MAG TPA: DsbA family protein [Gemmatimonadales bacterium]|nr:DsbA family protein [Gemmatimonadales bacterium]
MGRLTPPVGERDHVQGPANARVTLVEYGDFECPHCAELYPLIQAARKAFGGNLRFAFRHFPLRASHPHALAAARAAEAAGEQGKFWEMHDRLFQRQTELTDPDLRRHAGELGLDIERFARSFGAREHEVRIREDLASAAQSGARGTPSLFINGDLYEGALDRDELFAALARAAVAVVP